MPILKAISPLLCLLTVSCQVKPYAPPPLPTKVVSVEVEIRDFEGRPEAFAVVNGYLSSTAAQLVDAKQSRENRTIFLEVLEQTPRGANLIADLAMAPPFQTRIPVELLGLSPGPCILMTNGIETHFVIPNRLAVLMNTEENGSSREPAITLLDEFIPIEEFQSGCPN